MCVVVLVVVVGGGLASRHKNTYLHTHCEILCCHIAMRTFMLYNIKTLSGVYLYIKGI